MITQIDASIEPLIEANSHPKVDSTCKNTCSDTNKQPIKCLLSWQQQLAEAVTCPAELFRILELPEQYLEAAERAKQLFPLKVTHSYLSRIKKGDINDPLLRQILPLIEEFEEHADYSTDPVGDISATIVDGLLHKYQSRVLLMPTSVCGIHCRYCFRRHYPYSEHKSSNSWQQAIDYIQQDNSIHEVILSGGDPLSLSNTKLFRLLDLLENIPHLQRIRFHSRYPVILPDRIDPQLSHYLQHHRCKMVIVLHCNHPNELDGSVHHALRRLKLSGISLLNQSVLLAGINDNCTVLRRLSEQLFEHGVQPYYLHQLDKVKAAQHFEVSDEAAKSIMLTLRNQLSGYLIPKLVRENNGALAKQPLI